MEEDKEKHESYQECIISYIVRNIVTLSFILALT